MPPKSGKAAAAAASGTTKKSGKAQKSISSSSKEWIGIAAVGCAAGLIGSILAYFYFRYF